MQNYRKATVVQQFVLCQMKNTKKVEGHCPGCEEEIIDRYFVEVRGCSYKLVIGLIEESWGTQIPISHKTISQSTQYYTTLPQY